MSDKAQVAGLSPWLQDLLARTAFEPAHQEWLDATESQVAGRFERLKVETPRRVLLVNATKGLHYYTSIIDFFAQLQRAHPTIHCTSASYFDDVREYHHDVRSKGLETVPIADLMTWDASAVNRYDVALLIGASEVMARFMAMPGCKARLVLLHLGFYHQLLEAYPQSFLNGEQVIRDRGSQRNQITAYSCEPRAKVAKDLAGACSARLIRWRWFDYIPVGFRYRQYFRTRTPAFDVALLGSNGRNYAHIDPEMFHGVRFLYLGASEKAPGLDRLRAKADMTVVSGVDHETYARLLALCRCVVFPVASRTVKNSFLSLVDGVATGRCIVTRRHQGLERLAKVGLPARFYRVSWGTGDGAVPLLAWAHRRTARSLHREVAKLLEDDAGRQRVEAESVAFAREHFDVYRILWTILEEQVLQPTR